MSIDQDAHSVVSLETWLAALASSACIGCTSLVPWVFNMTFFERSKQLEQGDGRMKLLLSFAVGAILGDVFFHLIPESFHTHIDELQQSQDVACKNIGLSIIMGVFMFLIVEMLLEKWSHTLGENKIEVVVSQGEKDKLDKKTRQPISQNEKQIFHKRDLNQTVETIFEHDPTTDFPENNNNSIMTDLNTLGRINELQVEGHLLNGHGRNIHRSISPVERRLKFRQHGNKSLELVEKQDKLTCIVKESITDSKIPSKNCNEQMKQTNIKSSAKVIDAAGYLNLIANGFDNFTHGLAIGASFLVSTKVGLLTTFVIVIHEIPHEICDYAILVNSGFNRLDAVKAQSSVSLFGILGTATALCVKSVETLNANTIWILPFSAGGFLYIALVNILPEILDRKTNFRDTLGQIACVISGMAFMAAVAVI